MCLLLLMPDSVTADLAKLKVASCNNPDGFGFAISTGKKIITGQDMDFDTLANKFLAERAKNAGPAIFHLRIATHGSVNQDNCHPFFLGNDSQTVLAHNGILSLKQDPKDTRSDSKAFAQDIMPSVGGVTALDDDEYFSKLSKWASGSKIAFLTVHDDAKYDWYIVNEKEGHWGDDQVWWSNNSYKYTTPDYTRYGSSSYLGGYGSYGGWRDADETYWSKPYTTKPSGLAVPASAVVGRNWDDEDYDDEAGIIYDGMDEAMSDLFHFATQIDDDCFSVECYHCQQAEIVDGESLVYHTHCKTCNACMSCARTLKHAPCDCWDEWMEEMW